MGAYIWNRRADWIHRIPDSEWHVAFDFRANGEERSGGNIQLWYVKQASAVGTSSIYTVNKFDGLAITIDTHGGRVSPTKFYTSSSNLNLT